MGETKTVHDLVPLNLATRTIYERVYAQAHGKAGISCGVEQLNGIAYALAALVPVFTYEKDSVRRVNEDEMRKGLFREGGSTMIFLDGRNALVHLAVFADAVDQVARALSENGGPTR